MMTLNGSTIQIIYIQYSNKQYAYFVTKTTAAQYGGTPVHVDAVLFDLEHNKKSQKFTSFRYFH